MTVGVNQKRVTDNAEMNAVRICYLSDASTLMNTIWYRDAVFSGGSKIPIFGLWLNSDHCGTRIMNV